jgi:hypothetical protein
MIDGAREGKVDTAYMLRVKETGKGYFCLIVIECMRRDNRDLEIMFLDRNSAVHDGSNDGAVRKALI